MLGPTPCFNAMLRYVAIMLVLGTCGCVSNRSSGSSAGDVTWNRLVETLGQLEWSEADRGAAFEKAQKELGLENYGGMQLEGPLFVAHGDRRKVATRPFPKVWRSDHQKLLCAGDLYGNGKTEYVFGSGWFGPMGGTVCVYDDALRKIAEITLDSVIALELEDLTGDGGLEILCWQDRHMGTDGWVRYLQIFTLPKNGVLKPIWEGATYSDSALGGHHLTKQKIRIIRTRGKPSIIETKETYTRGTQEDTENGTSYSYLETPNTITRYVWNSASDTFETSRSVEPKL